MDAELCGSAEIHKFIGAETYKGRKTSYEGAYLDDDCGVEALELERVFEDCDCVLEEDSGPED